MSLRFNLDFYVPLFYFNAFWFIRKKRREELVVLFFFLNYSVVHGCNKIIKKLRLTISLLGSYYSCNLILLLVVQVQIHILHYMQVLVAIVVVWVVFLILGWGLWDCPDMLLGCRLCTFGFTLDWTLGIEIWMYEALHEYLDWPVMDISHRTSYL